MPPGILLLFQEHQEQIVSTFSEVLHEEYHVAKSIQEVIQNPEAPLIALPSDKVSDLERIRDIRRIIIATRAVDASFHTNERLISLCNYEYWYDAEQNSSRDVARFLGTVLGHSDHLNVLHSKTRSTLLSTTFSDIRIALSDMDILSIGSDAVEIRVDLLRNPADRTHTELVPDLDFVGEQIMLLRQRTELPLVFNIRCTQWNGRFPMENPMLAYKYLRKAIQWGCEYIDVELWLPEDIRSKLAAEKQNSRIISTWHDHSGEFRWTSTRAKEIFNKASVHGDVVKMVMQTEAHSMEDNHELELFRSTIQSTDSNPLFSGLNVGPLGQYSMIENNVLTPVTHPLLPLAAVQSQMSAAEINFRLSSIGKLPQRSIYIVGSSCTRSQAIFMEKVMNELSLTHRLLKLPSMAFEALTSLVAAPGFGGALLNPPLATADMSFVSISQAAKAIGCIDAIAMRSNSDPRSIVGHNIIWEGIKATLTKDFVLSAYAGRPAIVVANSERQAIPAVYTLSNLAAKPIFITGFKARGSLGIETRQLRNFKDLEMEEQPFVLVSALSEEKTNAVVPLLKYYGTSGNTQLLQSKVYLNLTNTKREQRNIADIATSMGWHAYSRADVNAFVVRSAMRLLTGCHVGYDFVKLVDGTSMV